MDMYAPVPLPSRIKNFLKRHGLALAVACAVGVFSIAPHFLASRALGDSYQGYPFIYQANEDIYMARIQEIIDGHPRVGSPLLYEYKNEWPPVLPVSEHGYAIPTILLQIPLAYTIVASKFILPATLFLLIYVLVLSLTRVQYGRISYWSAIAAGVTVTLGYDMVDYAHLPAMLRGTLEQTTLPLWTRPVNPISGALLLFSLILIVWNILTKKTRWWVPILGGLLLGATISYFFSWFLGGTIVGVLLLYVLYQRQWRRVLQLGAIIGVSFLVQIPHWYHLFLSWGSEASVLAQTRNGAMYTHAPILNKFLLAISFVFICCFAFEIYKRRSLQRFETWWIFCALLLTASWIAFNEQIITGMTIWPYHFVQYTIPLSMAVLFVLGCNYLASRFKYLWFSFLAVMIIVSFSIGLSSARSYRYLLDDFSVRQNYMPIFSWLNVHTPVDCVVLVDEPIENVGMSIAAFTHCNSYTTTYVPFSVPQERIVHNFFALLRLRGILPQDIRGYLESHPGEVNGYLYSSIDQSLFVGMNDETQRNIDMLVPAYQEFHKTSLASALKKYRVDYILTTLPTQTPPAELSLEKATESGSLILYKIK